MNLFAREFSRRKYVSLFFVILYISLRKLFFLDSDNMIGHNWDWTFPNYLPMFRSLNFVSLYTWWPIDLGTVTNLNISHIIPDTILAQLSHWISPLHVVILLIGTVISISFFSFKKLLDILTSRSDINFISSFLFSFSPFLLNEIIGGSWYMWISYAFAPIYFTYHLIYLRSGQLANLVLFLFSSIFVVSSLQNFVLLETLFLLYVFLRGEVTKSRLKNLVITYIFLFGLNIFWLYPFMLSIGTFGQTVTSVSFTGEFVAAKNSTQNFLSILTLVAYWDRNIYFYSLTKGLGYIFFVAVFILWSLIIVRVKEVKHNSSYITWLIIYLLVVLMAKGGNLPFSELTMWLYKINPLMALYRSPQHLIFACALITPILLGFVIQGYKKTRMKYLILMFVIIWISGWWMNGDLGELRLNDQGKDSVNFYTLPQEIVNLYSISQNPSDIHRIISLPSVISPFFVDKSFAKVGAGGQSEYLYLLNSTLTAENNLIARSIDEYMCNLSALDLPKVLSLINVRYLLVREDILPQHTSCLHKWSIDTVYKKLLNEKQLEQIASNSGSVTYRLTDKYFTPRIYIPSQIDILEGDYQKFIDHLSNKSYAPRQAIYLQNTSDEKGEIVNKISKIKPLRGESVEFSRINPTKYKVKLSGIGATTILVFLENFNRSWKLYPRGFLRGSVSDSNHFKINFYANGWIIDTEEICRNTANCLKEDDGTYTMDLTVEFEPQRRFYFGSVLTITFLSTGLIIYFIKRRKDAI